MTQKQGIASGEKHTSLSSYTLHLQCRLAKWTKSRRKHWDLFRWIANPFILHEATRLVLKNAGSAGLDGMTCEEIRGKEWDYSVSLSRRLKNRSYHPGAVRRVYIPKKNGKKRPLGIPNIDDRVVQRALSLVMEPIYEQVFLPCSYGFRPGKRAVDCVAETASAVYHHRHILEIDIKGFFDHVSHDKLMGMLKEQIVDPRVLNLIHEILKAGFQEVGKNWQPTQEGTPQGGPLSPLLANLYLHYALDEKFKDLRSSTAKLFRYADDFVVLSRTKTELLALSRLIKDWLKSKNLEIAKEKTRLVDMRNRVRSHSSNFVFLGYKIHLRAFRDNPKRFWVARQPSEAARKTLRQSVKEKLKPQLKPDQARQAAESIWKGWGNYFRYGNSNRVFYKEFKSVHRIVFQYLRHKYRRQRRPVPWRKLIPLGRKLIRNIGPIRSIPDSLRQRQQAWSLV